MEQGWLTEIVRLLRKIRKVDSHMINDQLTLLIADLIDLLWGIMNLPSLLMFIGDLLMIQSSKSAMGIPIKLAGWKFFAWRP